MAITVRYFARLREQLDSHGTEVDAGGLRTIEDVWHRATNQETLPDTVLCARNQQHARGSDAVSDGDEIAFFPQVTGG